MAIVQISKIQQRSGNLVDLPQLDEAEFGFAADEKRLFIGKTSEIIENIEVLTSYSYIDFNQINGAVGNLDISALSVANGQVLTYDGNNWVNRGGDAGGLITLGDASNVKITGGAIGYVLETDGTGNLSWTPKSSLLSYILNVEPAALSLHQTFATATDGTANLVTIDDLAGYSVNTAVVFSGTVFGNVVANTTYYISTVNTGNSTIEISTSNDGNVSNIVPLITDTGNMDLNIVGTVVTTAQDNIFTDGLTATVTDAQGMTELNGGSYYIDVLSANTLALYTDPAFDNALDSTTFTPYAYTDVTATTASTNIITVGDANSFAQFDPVIFVGTTFGNITANQTYYIANIVSPTEIKISTSDDGNVSNVVLLTTDTGTANVYVPGGRIISTIGGGGGIANAGGAQYSVQYNNVNILDGDANFTYNFNTRLLTIDSGNANVGNLNATDLVTASRLISNIANGTPPLQVISTDRVGNLNVAYSNVTDYSVVTAQNTGTFYPTFVSTNTTGNKALGVNSLFAINTTTSTFLSQNLTANAAINTLTLDATGNITAANIYANGGTIGATLLTGTLTTAAQPNVTSFGNATQVTVAGNLNPSANVTYNLGNTTNRWNALYLSGSTVYLGNATITSNGSGVVITNADGGSFTVSGTGTANSAAIVNGNSSVIVTANSNVCISSTGNANIFVVTGTGANIAGTINATGNANVGNIGAASGVLTGTLNVTGNANVGNLGTAQLLASANITTPQFISNVSNGTAPLIVTSTTQVANLNADTLDGYDTATAATANTIVVRDTNGNITGNNITGTLVTASQNNITSVGNLSSLTVTANVATGGIKTDNYYYANGVSISFAGAYSNSNVAAYLPTYTGTVGATTLTTGSNSTAGTITGNWTLSSGSKLQATYADIAENYLADDDYAPGTVLMFGGSAELTIADDETTKVAGVVSTEPSYIMNSALQGQNVVTLALIGRVPVKIRGNVSRGDLIVSAGNGYAKAMEDPSVGTVIGKAIADFNLTVATRDLGELVNKTPEFTYDGPPDGLEAFLVAEATKSGEVEGLTEILVGIG